MKDLMISVNVSGEKELENAIKKLNDAVKAVKQAAYELSMMGVTVELNIDKWKNR